ncbi:MAG: glycosyltransferase family 4 protein [Lachnospiraceae bacterium]|nr:glycosyltransferase family 4 protein [Lachnospiraceae bacterium]
MAHKILFVANTAKEHLNKFHLPAIRALKARGWQVDCASNGDEPVPYCDHDYRMSWQRNPFSRDTFTGIRELKALLAETHYDIIYCHTPTGGMVARIAARAARKQGTKVVYCVHGLHFYRGAPLKNWLVYFPAEKWLAGKTDAIFTVNREDYGTAYRMLSKARKGLSEVEKAESKVFNEHSGVYRIPEVRLVPEVGINTARLRTEDPAADRARIRAQYQIPEDAFVMIYIAELIPNKNQGMLLRALKILRDGGRNAHLVLVGPDHASGVYQKEAAELGLADRVTFTGWQSDIGPLLYASDVCTASSIREGFGINLAEAMYCGLPVVATDNRGHRMIVEDGVNGFLVPVDDSEAMAARVASLMDDRAFYARFASRDASGYDAERIAQEIADRLEALMDDPDPFRRFGGVDVEKNDC